MRIVKIAAAVLLALAVGVGTGYAANPRVPTGVVTLVVQPDTHFDVTCADGTRLSVVTDGGSEGHGYCAPLNAKHSPHAGQE